MNSTANRQAIRNRRAADQASDYRVSRAVIEGPGAGVSFWVANTRTRKLYVVHEGRCTCPDYMNRCQDAEGQPNGLKCKHVVLCEEFLGIGDPLPADDQEPAGDETEGPSLADELRFGDQDEDRCQRLAQARRDRDLLWD